MSRRFLYFAIAGLLLGALIVGLPFILEDVVDAELRERLERRGAHASWAQLSWQWPAGVELSDVEFDLRDGQLSGRVEMVRVELPWNAPFQDVPQIDSIYVRGVDATIDVAGSGGDEETSDPASDRPATSSLSRLFGPLGTVHGEKITARAVRGDTPLGTLEIARVRVENDGAGELAVEAEGTGRVEHPRIAALDLAEIDWKSRGTLIASPLTLTVDVESASPDAPLVEFEARDAAHLRVAAARVELRPGEADPLSIALHETAARLGAPDAPAVELAVAELAAEGLREPAPALRATKPTLTVAPSRLGALRGMLADSGSTPTQTDASAKANGSKRSASQRLAWLLGRLDGVVIDGRLDLLLEDAQGDTRQITLVDALDATVDGGDVAARGESAGGRFEAYGVFEPGMLLPRTLTVSASDVRLETLPGVKEGRTLPNRGIRGKIGGVVDATVVLLTEGEPLLREDPGSAVTMSTSLRWRDGRIELSGLADEPLTGIDAGLRFDAEWNPAMGTLELSDGQATYGPIDVSFTSSLVDWPFEPVFDLEAKMEEIACQEAIRAFPTALLGAYDDIAIDGSAAPDLRFHLPVHRPKKLVLEIDGFVDKCHVTALEADKEAWPEVRFRAKKDREKEREKAREKAREKEREREKESRVPADSADSPRHLSPTGGDAARALQREAVGGPQPVTEPQTAPYPTPPHLADVTYELPELPDDYDKSTLDDVWWLNRPFIMQVTEGVSEDAEVLVGPGTDAYVPMDELEPFVGGASYLSEEMEFYRNHGIDLGLIEKAMRINFEGERFVYGGSTVTQQLVKNLFLTRDKTLARKLKEALIAWRIEDVVPKWRVLELYLNCIEYGPDVYGIGPAAQYYFGKDAPDLTPKEAVFLAILKPAPWYGDRFRRRGNTPTKHWWFNRMHEIMERLVDKGYLTPEQAEAEKPYILYWDKEGEYRQQGSEGTRQQGKERDKEIER